MVLAAKKYGFHVPVHVGGASVPGSSVIGAETVVALQLDVAVHCNGGPTAPSNVDIARIIDETAAGIEVVQAGNIRALIDVVKMLRERGALDRLQIASDTPSGTSHSLGNPSDDGLLRGPGWNRARPGHLCCHRTDRKKIRPRVRHHRAGAPG